MDIKPIEVFAREQNASGSLLLNRIKQIDGEVLDEAASICIQSTIDAKELTNAGTRGTGDGGGRGEEGFRALDKVGQTPVIPISIIQISSSVHFRHT